ncbi:sugar transferase [Sedimentitalea sp. JM2-8]|uniref:Sugar transferase n=1 Tax=Sedimentitalea xiamensis TaxID=3050037 RepID=A0ABT7FAZ5_9RHOB|nr:sugar transferase [Sedimentitalea xiamensis]MDK3072293.1 sugar transferase [Sedimentitalea xiamensis]
MGMRDQYENDRRVGASSKASDLPGYMSAMMLMPLASMAATGYDRPFRSGPFASKSPFSGWYPAWGKRALDIALVVLALPVVLPLVLLCIAALWIEGGSPFYRQARIGRNGAEFFMLKLRSMVRDADSKLQEVLARDPALRAEWDETQKLKSDPRITRVGAFLRASSLDELPQLWNVLTGDMSLVGPRPMMPDQASIYGDLTDYKALTPGLTGVWQVSSRNESSFAHRATIDAAYRRSLSLRQDVGLLLKTVAVVLRRTGY